MKRFSLLKIALLSLSVSGCGSVLPAFPEVWQCAHKSGKFYCVNTKSGDKKILRPEDMNAAQCLSASDYRKSEAWVARVKELAETRCE